MTSPCCFAVLAVLLTLSGGTRLTRGAGPVDALPRDKFHLYLLVGQSNMAGRGKMTAADHEPVEGVFMLDASGTWQPARHPLHDDKPTIAGVGLGLSFAEVMRAHDSGAVIGLIPCAVGGTRIDQWAKGGKLYMNAIDRARRGASDGVVRGILWHQGESDSTEELAPMYYERLELLIADFRHDLETPTLPVVLGELGRFRQEKYPFTGGINKHLQQVSDQTPHVALASSAGLVDQGDATHLDADSLRAFGRRFAEQMLSLEQVP